MKKALATVLFIAFTTIISTAQANCSESLKMDGILFMIENYNSSSLKFKIINKKQFAFKNKELNGYVYHTGLKTCLDNLVVNFDPEDRLTIRSFTTQRIGNKFYKIIELEKGLGLMISTNKTHSFTCDKNKIITPKLIEVLPKDNKTFSANLEGYKYKFEVKIGKLMKTQDKILVQKEKEIKEIIINTEDMNPLEAKLVKIKTFQINKITYQLSE